MSNPIYMLKYFTPPPIIGSVYKYQDVNKNKEFRKEITNHFKTKLYDWLNDEYYNQIINNFLISNDGIIFGNKTYNNHTNQQVKLIKEHIYQTYYTERTVYKLLKSYTKKYDLKWWDLRKNDKYVKIFIFKYLKNKLNTSQ